jgi:hypothetical protein
MIPVLNWVPIVLGIRYSLIFTAIIFVSQKSIPVLIFTGIILLGIKMHPVMFFFFIRVHIPGNEMIRIITKQ